ncbi:serine hydrolase domain-containing protein [Conexibacter woesei]|uniref:Beta-lactamase n=1 Tax=Conexibacter woesei (strain DSM 14684 / CCUG 47730 / CIP 108061 / JCM 11494 / NBRC 100937 / ID131577) TaxID=469383 RepID=D3F603_CONWI|nr:serine hydrolase domain-containing protein [Conexibacter woesei]ADB48676.1 beta-lactamase [Conexibacter woesei DSM 14684]
MTTPSGDFDLVLDLIRGEVDSGRLPTAVFGVATSSGVQVLEAFGSHGRRPLATDDTFLLFSASKPLIGLAALRLVEQGKLALRTALSEALPQFGMARIGDEVTLWHLLTHTAGIVEATVTPDTPVREQLLTAPQMFRAGEYALYCNVAFEGIAALVESVTGRPLHEHLPADLNALPGVEGLTFDPAAEVVPLAGLDRVLFDVERFRALRHPAGSLCARAEDLLSLGSMLLRGDRELIHPTTLSASLTPQTTGIPRLLPDPLHIGPGTGQEWGLVWNMRMGSPTLLEQRLYGHGGLSGCQWWMYPDHDACFVLLTGLMNPLDVGVDLDNVHNAFTTCLDPVGASLGAAA